IVAPNWISTSLPCNNYRATMLCDDCPAGPANDNCANAATLPCNAMQTYSSAGAGIGPEDAVLSCSLAGNYTGVASVWYRFVAGSSTAAISTCPIISGGLSDTMLAVYRATNASDP